MGKAEAGLTLLLDMPHLLYLTAKKKKTNISLRGKACRASTYFSSRLQNWLTPWGPLYPPSVSVTPMHPHADLPTAPSSQPLRPHIDEFAVGRWGFILYL